MGFINLLKNGYTGKVGETVGQKWKNTLTLRTYNEHNNSKTEAQLNQRDIYKENISQSSIAYSTLVGVNKSVAKGMNLFNLFTSQWSKTNGSVDDSWIKSKIFDKPNLTVTLADVFSGPDGIFCVYYIPPELDLKSSRRFVVKGFFCTENQQNQTIVPIIDNIAAIGVGSFDNDNVGQVTDNGLIINHKDNSTRPGKTILQLSFEFKGKYYATNLISDYLNVRPSEYQYSSTNYIWKAPYFS